MRKSNLNHTQQAPQQMTTTVPHTRALDYAINTESPATLEQGVRAVLALAVEEFERADPSSFVLLPLTQGVTNIRAYSLITRA